MKPVRIVHDYIPCRECRYSKSTDRIWGKECSRAPVVHSCPEGAARTTYMYCDEAVEQFRNIYGKCPYFSKGRLAVLWSSLVDIFRRINKLK